jgi:chitinase
MVNGIGFGATIKAINGGECGSNPSTARQNRINLYKSYCATLGVDPGSSLTC